MTLQCMNQPSSAARRAWGPPMPLFSERLLQLSMEEGICLGLRSIIKLSHMKGES